MEANSAVAVAWANALAMRPRNALFSNPVAKKKCTAKAKKKPPAAKRASGKCSTGSSSPFDKFKELVSLASGGSKWVIGKSDLIELLDNQGTLVQRMLAATRAGNPWLTLVGNASGKGNSTKIDLPSAMDAYRRLLAGDQPPLMRSEENRKAGIKKIQLNNFGEPDSVGRKFMQILDLLPPGTAKATFDTKSKTFTVDWADKDFQAFRMSSARGERRKLCKVSFKKPGEAQPSAPEKDDPFGNNDCVETGHEE